MKHSISIILLLLFQVCAFGQNESGDKKTVTVQARIFDFASQKPVPYAKVYNKQNQTGTLSNSNGYFKLENVGLNDTILISFVGYDAVKITGKNATEKDSIFIYPKTEILSEVVILSDNNFLYELISNCKKTEHHQTKIAKTYFELESFINKQQVELVECYYNGVFSGYDVDQLKLKNGRLALSPFNQRMFLSTQTSEAFILNKLMENGAYFPAGSMASPQKKLKKEFNLNLESKYKSENQHTIYVIHYEPKDTSGYFFSGSIWIDSTQNTVLKITHEIQHAAIYPFALIGRSDSLSNVNLEISKTFQSFEDHYYLQSIDFNYSFQYKYRENDSMQTIASRAILYAYDYENQFTLPYFNFTESMYGDYVKILATPYNDFFWKNIREFKMNDEQQKNDQFFRENGNNTLTARNFNKADSAKWNFEKPYIFWSEKRVVFREDLNNNIVQTKIGGVPSDFYNLKVQLYLDVNLFNDTLHILSSTIFDPFETYFYYPINPVSLTFINVYFDLMEIQRREMEIEILSGEKTKTAIAETYQRRLYLAEKMSATYFKEVERGNNQKAMLKWNTLVQEKLKIDNVKIFNPYERTD
jgi:hypothetical protein